MAWRQLPEALENKTRVLRLRSQGGSAQNGLTEAEVTAPGTVLLHEGPPSLTEAEASPGIADPLLIQTPWHTDKEQSFRGGSGSEGERVSSNRRASGCPTRRPGRCSSGPCRWRWDASGPSGLSSARVRERGRSRGPLPGPGR